MSALTKAIYKFAANSAKDPMAFFTEIELWRTVWRFLKNTGNRTAIHPSNPTAGHTHRGNQN